MLTVLNTPRANPKPILDGCTIGCIYFVKIFNVFNYIHLRCDVNPSLRKINDIRQGLRDHRPPLPGGSFCAGGCLFFQWLFGRFYAGDQLDRALGVVRR